MRKVHREVENTGYLQRNSFKSLSTDMHMYGIKFLMVEKELP